jgi:subtilisin family serine protease
MKRKANFISTVVVLLFGLPLFLAVLASAIIATSAPEDLSSAPSIVGDEEQVYQLTLITGDTVNVIIAPDGGRRFAVSPARPDRLGQNFLTIEQKGDTYIIPDGVDLEKLDIELFNVDYLVDEQYHEQPSLPLLISYLPGLDGPEVQSLESKLRALGADTTLHADIYAISTRLAYENISASFDNLMSQPGVEKIWLDKKVHAQLNDSVLLIGAPSWWATGYNGTGEEIAILDTGVDSSHPALDDLDDDPGTTDRKVIINVNFTDDANFNDLYGHGTHVAGIAAGTYAGSIYQGVAPGAQLWNVKVLNQYGWGYESWIINGVSFASLGPDGITGTEDEADIINMSLGALNYSDGTDPLSQAVNLAAERGVVVVVAAGNHGSELNSIGTPGVAEKVITVGASDKNDTLASFSSRGPTVDARIKPDILAPSVEIVSSVPGGAYESMSGTSMGTPHVAGAAALILEASGNEAPSGLSLSQFVKDALMCSSEDLGYNVYEQGSGRLDLDTCWGAETVIETIESEELAWSGDIKHGAAHTTISYRYWDVLVTPASLSLGEYGPEGTTASGNLTFLTGSDAHDVTLAAELTDILSGIDYSGSVTLSPPSFTIPHEGEVDVSLDVDLTNLPASFYSGKIIAAIDGDSDWTIHAIFGFTKVCEVNIHKVDITGAPAQQHPVWIIREVPSQSVSLIGYTDESGNLTLSTTTGRFHLLSYGTDEANQISIWTITENVTVCGDTSVELDERDTRVIDFDPKKPEQIPSAKEAKLYYYSGKLGDRWGSSWWYPSSFITRISPASRFLASFNYQYYPEADFFPDNPQLVNTSEWHNLVYPLVALNDNTSLRTRLLVVMSPEINSIADLNKGTIYAYRGENLDWLNTALSVYGITFKTYTTHPDEYLWLLEKGYADAVLVPIHPCPYLEDYIAKGTVRLLPWSPEAVNAVVDAYPQEVIATELAPYTYEGQTESVPGYAPKNQSPVADYDNLAQRHTTYSTALTNERAYWQQQAYDAFGGWWSGFTYLMDAPQERWEWLSPEPVEYYDQDYYKAEPQGEWYFDSPGFAYEPGEYSWGMGGHPLTSGVELMRAPIPTPVPPTPPPTPTTQSDETYGLYIWGYIFEDTFNNTLSNQQAGYTGNLTVTRDGEVVLDEAIRNYVSEIVDYEDTADFTVEVWGRTPLALSTESYTRLDFTANPDQDMYPPQLLFQVPGIDLNCVVPNGGVIVRVLVTENSLIENVDLFYSTDDQDNWIDAEAPATDSGWYKFNLGELQDTYINLKVDAEDEYGNRIRYTIHRAFHIGDQGVKVSVNAPDTVPPGEDFTASNDIVNVVDLNAAQYDIRFDPSVLQWNGIDGGRIGSTNMEAVPNELEAGHWQIVQYPIPKTAYVSGSGCLAVLKLQAIGALGTSSDINITDGTLVGKEGEIPAIWIGDTVTVSGIPGDANEDGKIDSSDLVKVLKIILEVDSPTYGADANRDGNINVLDLVAIKTIILGLD